MTDTNRHAYLVVCGTTLGGEVDPEYAKRAGAAAENINIAPIASGNVGTERLKVLEGELPPSVTFMAVERFPSMAAIEEFWFSDAYQSSIPFRKNAVKMNYVIALEGISEAELEAARQVALENSK